MSIALIVHGGAGTWKPGSDAEAIAGTTAAVAAGRKILEAGGSALDAAIAAATTLENNPIFNAGTGAVLNFDGFVELDACVMVSEKSQVGAVTGLRRVKNPIMVARQVMEQTDHVMLTGEGATRFARVMGHADYDPITPARRADWADKKNRLGESIGGDTPQRTLKLRSFLQAHPEYAGGTIGAVAVDKHGVLCAATSTGGMTMKMVGRVGDAPLPGCGTYADKLAASSATGTGEFVIRAMSCRQISDNVAKGMTIQQAVDAALDYLGREFDADVGLIAIDAKGAPYGNHRTADMPHAWFSGTGEIIAKMRVAR
ncbi:MAG TPA: isoaspartyl peptidase/L-asparaginase family protein [Usitatibacteraceae bacterium]